MKNTAKILVFIVALALVFGAVCVNAFAAGFTDYVIIGEQMYVADEDDDGVERSALWWAMTDANKMTGDVVLEIYGTHEFVNKMELNGSYSSITFNGMTDTAKITINQSAGGDYLEAHGKTVAFNDLTLAKANPAWSGNSGHMGNYFSIQGGNATYTNCVFPNGACTSTGTANYVECTFNNSSEYGIWVYDDAIVSVSDSTIDSVKGIKVYSEGEDSVTSTLTVENSTFTENVTAKPAVAIGYAESITLIGNTYNNPTCVIELDSGSDADCNGIDFVAQDSEGKDISSTLTCTDRSNNDAACGVLVNGQIYTTASAAAEVAGAGDTVTMLYESDEEVEFAYDVVLDTNGYTAENVKVALLDGAGTEEDPFIIQDLEDLKNFRDDVNAGNNYDNKYIKLTTDIDLSSIEWTPIGNGTNTFNGMFDGDNHVISNLYIPGDKTYVKGGNNDNNKGFFGYMKGGDNAGIKNLTINNASVTGCLYVGAILGHSYTGGIIENCHVTGNILVDGYSYIGGIVGRFDYSKGANVNGDIMSIYNCSVKATSTEKGKINSVYTLASYVGGIVGFTTEPKPVMHFEELCVSNISVTGYSRVGGISGIAHAGNIYKNCSVEDAYIYGTDEMVGVIAGACNGTSSYPVTFEGNDVDTETVSAYSGETQVENLYGTNTSGAPATTNYVARIGDVYYESLADAFAAGGEVVLLLDITLDTAITVPDGVTIDLNGNTLYVNVENSYYNNVTITNGNIVLGKDDVHVCDGYFIVNAGKTLVIDDVNISSSEDGIKGYAVFHLKTGAGVDITDSEIDIENNEYAEGYMIYAGEKTATVDIVNSSVSINGNSAIVHATTVIDNSTLTVEDPSEHGINRSGLTINDSTVTISGGTGRGITAQHGELVITGNSSVTIFNMGDASIELRDDQNATVEETATVKLDSAINNTSNGTVTGAIIPIDAVANADGVYEIVEAVVEVDGVYYATLQAAIDAAKSGSTIVLLDDIVLTEGVVVANDDVLTLDLNGKTVSMVHTEKITANHAMLRNYGDLTIKDSVGGGKLSYNFTGETNNYGPSASTVENVQGKLTVESGTIESLTTVSKQIKYAINNLTNGNNGESIVVINGGNIYAAAGASLRGFANSSTCKNIIEINGGTFNAYVQMQEPDSTKVDNFIGSIVVNGGTFNSVDPSNSDKYAFYVYGVGDASGINVEINDGTFNGTVYLCVVNATNDLKASINGGTYNGEVWACSWINESECTNMKVIKNGSFATDVSAYCVSGFRTVYNAATKSYAVVSNAVYPHIGDDGYWYIGEENTGFKANGDDGFSPTISEDGYWIIKDENGEIVESKVKAVATDGKGITSIFINEKGELVVVDAEGEKVIAEGVIGTDGVSVKSVEKTSTEGNVDTYTITLTNDETFTFTVTNGIDGEDGAKGDKGDKGDTGLQGDKGETGADGNDNNGIVTVAIIVAAVSVILALSVLLYRGVKRRSWWCTK